MNKYLAILLLLIQVVTAAAEDRKITNSIGMELVCIEPGSFVMGFCNEPLPDELINEKGLFHNGDFDEHPSHLVTITNGFYMGACEVTNAQYELYDPEHKKLRGVGGCSLEDNEAVVFVSHSDVVGFCRWLSEKEDKTYRLPTEAEWEYACRAGTTTAYYTGSMPPTGLDDRPTREHKADGDSCRRVQILKVGLNAPNAWGLYDMHGNIQERCSDWYGPYERAEQADPVGRVDGDCRVTRGGSFALHPYYMRSSNRSGTIPQDRRCSVGFRVVMGEPAASKPLPGSDPPWMQREVDQRIPKDLERGPDPDKPYFEGPRVFVKIPDGSVGPLYARHNHEPTIVECPNGDLLAAWFSCVEEQRRAVCIAASRLRHGSKEWGPASVFWDVADRYEVHPVLWNDGKGTLYHFNDVGDYVTYDSVPHEPGMIIRKSTDSGATWTKAQPARIGQSWESVCLHPCVFRAGGGEIVLPCDRKGNSYVLLSDDDGLTWHAPGGEFPGIHPGVAQLSDRRFMALTRGSFEGKMPLSISKDMGGTWTIAPSQFQPISSGQRLVLKRLREGPLFLASFCDDMMITDASGCQRPVSGIFAAVSFDDGKTWPHMRLMTDDGPGRFIETMDGHAVRLSAHESEYAGYMTACQTKNGLINLLTSRQHYVFNLKWLTTPAPAVQPMIAPEKSAGLVQKTDLAVVFRPRQLPAAKDCGWEFQTEGIAETEALHFSEDLAVLETAKDSCWWRNSEAEYFGRVDARKGFTAEVATRILSDSPDKCGVTFELYDGVGSRYAVTVKAEGVYWYEGSMRGSGFMDLAKHTLLAGDLVNSDRMHIYRLTVRPDRVVEIYRDGALLGTKRAEYRTPRDAYICFGGGGGLKAMIDYLSFDIGGPYVP